MSINETIIQAVTPIVPVCVPDAYRPDAGETPAEVYCVFNYTERGTVFGDESPDVFGDDEPQAILYLIQLHLYLPLGQTPIRLKRQLRRAMLDAGLAVGDYTNASDLESQHYVLECQALDLEVG